MKLQSLFLFALTALLTLSPARPAHAARPAAVSFDFFYDALSPHGEWLEVGDYGYCWKPANVDEDWAPYSDGYWAYTDAGWTWVSYEEFGGIVYHYGRWVKVEDEGWVWVPDYEWGPAWVSWRKNDDYVGWAPLPAEAHFEPERGISVWADTSYDIGPAHYSFCHTRDFGAPVLRPLLLRRSENIVFIGETVNITNISYNRNAGCVYNGGLDYRSVNRFQSRPIPALKLVRNTNVTVINNRIVNNNVTINNFNSVQRGNQLTVLAPTVVRPQQGAVAALLKPRGTRVIGEQKVNHGWANVPNERREAIRASLAQQTQGKTPETTAAIAPKVEDLKVVPVKADPNAKIPGGTRKFARATPVPQPADAKPVATTQVPAVGTPQPGIPQPGAPVAVDPAKMAREKGNGKRPGKGVPPVPTVAQEAPVNPPTEGAGAAPLPPVKGGKPFVPVNPPTATAGTNPVPPVKGGKAAQKAGKGATPAPATEVTDNPPAGIVTPPSPVVRGKAPGGKPEIMKPFNPTANDDPVNVRPVAPPAPAKVAPPVPNNAAIDKRNAAAEAAKKQNMAQEAARERAAEVKVQQQQEAARQGDAQQAAAARLRMQQQQQQQQQQLQTQKAPPPPPKVKVAPQVQQNQQNQQQELLKQRAAQAAQTQQRAAAAQQSQAAAVARQQASQRAQAQANAAAAQQQSQAAAVARQQTLQRAQAQAAARPPAAPPPAPRNVPQAVPRTVAPPVAQPQKAVPAKGKRPLTPEEEAALKKVK